MISGVTQDISTLLRGEIELVKAEISQQARTVASGSGLLVGAAVIAGTGALFLLLTLAWLLDATVRELTLQVVAREGLEVLFWPSVVARAGRLVSTNETRIEIFAPNFSSAATMQRHPVSTGVSPAIPFNGGFGVRTASGSAAQGGCGCLARSGKAETRNQRLQSFGLAQQAVCRGVAFLHHRGVLLGDLIDAAEAGADRAERFHLV
jgi:hypothetical protein